MNKKLWEASLSQKKKSNLFKFESFISKKFKYKPNKKYKKLLNWSNNNLYSFWSLIWDYTKVKGNKVDKFIYSKEFIKNKFFVNSKLNFAENLLSKKDNSKAITFISENGYREVRSWKNLNHNASRLIDFLKKNNISKKDRIAAYMSNQIEKADMNDLTTTINSGNYQSIVNSIRATNDEDAQKRLKGELEEMIKETIYDNFGLDNFMHNNVKVNFLDNS